MKSIFFAAAFLLIISPAFAQLTPEQTPSLDSLKMEVMKLDQKMDMVQFNLEKSGRRSKLGIIVSTIGYSVTIAGGLMLGGSNNDLGEALLYTGGAIGVTGTVILIDSFKYLRIAGGKSP